MVACYGSLVDSSLAPLAPLDGDDARGITSLDELKALTHPVRLALLDALTVHRLLTATEAGRLIGESPTSCSFHLRQLARYGFVEPAGEPGRRARPWRLTSVALQVPLDETATAATQRAAQALGSQLLERQLNQYQRWVRERAGWAPDWQEAADQSQYVLWVTPDELLATVTALRQLLAAYRSRLTNPAERPDGARPVQVVTLAHPLVGVHGEDSDED